MKLKSGFSLHEVCGEKVLIAEGIENIYEELFFKRRIYFDSDIHRISAEYDSKLSHS